MGRVGSGQIESGPVGSGPLYPTLPDQTREVSPDSLTQYQAGFRAHLSPDALQKPAWRGSYHGTGR